MGGFTPGEAEAVPVGQDGEQQNSRAVLMQQFGARGA